MFNQKVTETYDYAQISASTNIALSGGAAAGPGSLAGIFVSIATTNPSITIYDDPASGTTTKIVDTFTPNADTFYPLPANYRTGCNVVLAGTVSCTVFFNRP